VAPRRASYDGEHSRARRMPRTRSGSQSATTCAIGRAPGILRRHLIAVGALRFMRRTGFMELRPPRCCFFAALSRSHRNRNIPPSRCTSSFPTRQAASSRFLSALSPRNSAAAFKQPFHLRRESTARGRNGGRRADFGANAASPDAIHAAAQTAKTAPIAVNSGLYARGPLDPGQDFDASGAQAS